jgi:DNA-binding response OmpR family regulator
MGNSNQNEPRKPARICVIDDDVSFIRTVERVLHTRHYLTLGITQAIGCTSQVRGFKPHLILLDLDMPLLNGEQMLEILKRHLESMPPVILYSGLPPHELEIAACRLQVADFVYKGHGFEKLLSKVSLHLDQQGDTPEAGPGKNGEQGQGTKNGNGPV